MNPKSITVSCKKCNTERKCPCSEINMCKRLKEAGYPQKARFSYWIKYCDNPEKPDEIAYFEYGSSRDGTCGLLMNGKTHIESFANPIAEEILRELPDMIEMEVTNPSGNHKRYHVYASSNRGINLPKGTQSHADEHDTLANAEAQMWIYLKKNNLIPPNQ